MNSVYDTTQFVSDCNEIGIKLSDMQIQRFLTYYELLIEWNENVNLTAITEFNDVMKKHFVDSISIVNYFNKSDEFNGLVNHSSNNKYKLIDVGTGAGFPGIPIKIVFPEIDVLLLDSLQKRVQFLDTVISQLNLSGISTVHSRAEDAGKSYEYRENFDFAVSRAVSNLSTLSEYCLPFVRINGRFIAYKSEKLCDEINTMNHGIEILGGVQECIHSFTLPNSEINRSLCVMQKVKKTPGKYPRKAGTPLKSPLS